MEDIEKPSITIKNWYAVVEWSYNIDEANCSICKSPSPSYAPNVPTSSLLFADPCEGGVGTSITRTVFSSGSTVTRHVHYAWPIGLFRSAEQNRLQSDIT